MTSIKRRMIRLVERAGLRKALGALGTFAARRTTGQDVELFFDGIWIRRVGDRYYGDKPTFDYYASEFKTWNYIHDLWANDPVDCWFYDYRPRPGDIVVDIGAGFGNDAIVFSRAVGPAGKVVAIEAHPVSFRKLQKTCKWNELSNVIPVEAAIDERNGVVTITGENDNASNAVGGAVHESEYKYQVVARRFDDVAQEAGIEKIALLKMNIEGAERAALLGMPNMLQATDRVAIACHDFRAARGGSDFFQTKDFVRQTLSEAGFALKFREDDPRPYVADTIYGARRFRNGGSSGD